MTRLDRVTKGALRTAVLEAVRERHGGRAESWAVIGDAATLLGGDLNKPESYGLPDATWGRSMDRARTTWMSRVRRMLDELAAAGELVKVGRGERLPSGQSTGPHAVFYTPAAFDEAKARVADDARRQAAQQAADDALTARFAAAGFYSAQVRNGTVRLSGTDARALLDLAERGRVP